MLTLFRGLPLVAVLALWSAAAQALELSLPVRAELTRAKESPAGTYDLPLGPYANGKVPTRAVEGRVARRAWRIDGEARTTLEIFAPLREQVAARGYDILFECRDESCGGFDFRFGVEVMPAPDMFVDLFDYRFLSARKNGRDDADYVSVLVSRAGGAGYVQIVAVGDAPVIDTPTDRAETARSGNQTGDAGAGVATLIERLLAQGHVVLPDLEFDTGAAALSDGNYASLAALAEYLKANAGRRIALVGHTDTVGGLDANVSLSRRRAASVVTRLVERHGVPAGQLESNGMGYLSPIAPNTTERGREANRRVEAVLLEAE
ncbi:OmpA family protein [Roseovarius salis]|uniref:OmpA family protein n=1 Tax=Roseovarius salis TaxID=3376063 RepID=UPI0037C780B7